VCNKMYYFNPKIPERVQVGGSQEGEQVQLCDFLTGAISYANRGLTTNPAKVALVERLRQRSGYQLTRTTLLRERKLNLFVWQPQERVA